jgi:hypothetical protein
MKMLSLCAVAAVALAGCGSAADPSPSPPGAARPAADATATAAPGPPPTGALRRALLAVGDLPHGYRKDPQSLGGAGGHPVPRCRVVVGSIGDAVDSAVVGRADTGFEGGDARPLVAESLVSLQRSDAAAESTRLTRTLAACRTFSFTDSEGARYTYTVEPMAFPSLGDESTAVRVTLTTKGPAYDFTMTGAQVLVRVDRTLATVVTMGLPGSVPADEFQQTVRTAVQKLG